MLKTKTTKILLSVLILASSLCAFPLLTLEQVSADEFLTITPGVGEGAGSAQGGARDYILEDPQLTDIPYLLEYAIKFMLALTGLAAVFFIFYGAFQYISGFTIEQKQKGKTQILYAIVGLIVITLSYALVETLTQVLF
ncbi:MAG: hypothetical protein PHU71_00540 [Candidatus Gracilibacteria bacterium]|nr:hypothetical protein [Candidatus Gracilibacteria bacterium]